jgi:CubicO group peptidase (beta-lactamase class C family)
MALMVAACSASPAEQLDPSPTTQASATPPNYRLLGESIEEAIASGSVALDTIGAVLINADGQTVLTHYRHGRKPDKTMHVYSVTKSVLSALIGSPSTRSSSRTSSHPSASSCRVIEPRWPATWLG